jgi:hypothetical protein
MISHLSIVELLWKNHKYEIIIHGSIGHIRALGFSQGLSCNLCSSFHSIKAMWPSPREGMGAQLREVMGPPRFHCDAERLAIFRRGVPPFVYLIGFPT